ncbi:MAG: hypothetical protein U0528_07740 [Anaerolineae bacterium]
MPLRKERTSDAPRRCQRLSAALSSAEAIPITSAMPVSSPISRANRIHNPAMIRCSQIQPQMRRGWQDHGEPHRRIPGLFSGLAAKGCPLISSGRHSGNLP